MGANGRGQQYNSRQGIWQGLESSPLVLNIRGICLQHRAGVEGALLLSAGCTSRRANDLRLLLPTELLAFPWNMSILLGQEWRGVPTACYDVLAPDLQHEMAAGFSLSVQKKGAGVHIWLEG
mmetsp:Transcript_88836/g.275948  ORF Transcript_88836/g.275948 Transcript_88836/m.275948 type:complete len:122 (+) Transcript_88836:662-1027(+)